MRVRFPSFDPCETTGIGGSVSSHPCHLGLGAKVSQPNPSDTPDRRRPDVLDTGRVPLAADVSEIGTYRLGHPLLNVHRGWQVSLQLDPRQANLESWKRR